MRGTLLISISLLFIITVQAQKMKNVQKTSFVKGVAMQKNHTCSEDEEEEWKSIALGKFKIVKGSKYSGQEVESYFSTSPEGKFLIELKPGTYSIVEADRPEVYSGKKKDGKYLWNTLCLDSKWSEPLVTFKLEIGDPIEIELSIDRYN